MSKERVFRSGGQVRALSQVISACFGTAAFPGEAWSQAGLCVGPRLGSGSRKRQNQKKKLSAI